MTAALRLAAFVASLLASAAACAQPAKASYEGTWEGSIGALPIRACFTSREWGAFGIYFYLSHLRSIPLTAQGQAGAAYREGAEDGSERPRWDLRQGDGNTLSGTWSSGRRTLPIRLKRLAVPDAGDSPCASAAFHAPRLEGVRTLAAPESSRGTAYTRLTLSHGGRFEVAAETFALDRTDAAARRINAELAQPLAGSPPAWLQCTLGALEIGPSEGHSEERIAPHLFTSRWLSVTHYSDSFCGGVHPNTSNLYRTFDLVGGREVDLLDWLGARAVKRERFDGSSDEAKTLTRAFRRALLAGWKEEEPECAGVIRGQEWWNAGLTRTGFVFTPLLAHAVQACGETFSMPFAKLRPFLTPEGARHVRAIEAELGRRQRAS